MFSWFYLQASFFVALADYSITRICIKINIQGSKEISKSSLHTYSVLIDYK